jgi:hypothetical protein
MLTLRTLVLLHHARLILPSYFFLMLSPSLLGVDCLSSLLPGARPSLTPLPQADPISRPRQCPTPMAGTMTGQDSFSCPPLQKQEAQYVHTLYK